MVVVLFEAFPKQDRQEQYFDLAAQLKPELEDIRGFISIERFRSLSNPDKLLSLSVWEDEESIQQWRRREGHRAVQKQGRSGLFDDYRIQVARVVRVYGMKDRAGAPEDSLLFHG